MKLHGFMVSFLNNGNYFYEENEWFLLTKYRPQYYIGLVNDATLEAKLLEALALFEKGEKNVYWLKCEIYER